MNADGAVAVVGLGRVGLPLALVLAERGFEVIGVDVNAAHVETIRRGEMPFLEKDAPPLLEKHAGNRLTVSTDPSGIGKAHSVILTLGTPVDEHMNPIFSQIEAAVGALLPHLVKDQQVILRSTVSPGTTRYLARFIEGKTDFRIGQDLFLAFCPERISEGNSVEEIPQIPQIVGADDPASRTRAAGFFRHLTEVIHETDSISAELAKLYSNMFRYINFAAANEFMMIAEQHDRDIYEILHLVNDGYKRGGLAPPGLTGGPCLYKDGFFLVSRTPFTEMISVSWKINETVPAYLIDRIKRLRDLAGTKVAILGLAFKRDIDDTRNSLSYKARKIFHAEGAEVRAHDPFVPSPSFEEATDGADVVFVAINHTPFREIDWNALRGRLAPDAVICDIWNLTGTGKVVYRNGDLPRTTSAS